MTLSVFILEDDYVQRELLEAAITDYITTEGYEAELVISTDSPTDFLRCFEERPKKSNLYILDINLNHEMNGIDVARKIREHDFFGYILFVTTHADMSYLVFRNRIEALDYIIKVKAQDVIKRVHECIKLAYDRCKETASEQAFFHVKSSIGIQRIPIEDIMFFETSHVPHKLILHTKSDRIEFRGNLKDVMDTSPDFFRCHKAYVVNTKNIKRMQRIGKTTGEVEMINEAVAPVSANLIGALAKIIRDVD